MVNMENQLTIQKIENFEVGEYLDLVKTAKEYAAFARTIDDIKFVREGLQIILRKSKIDQEGKEEE
ncbi:hypothetical protein [Candidatus Protochlamydia amoebophila]|uniref:hypothetical protein n=1 Tax=Candidatus Protochlamydia amoebophila TaxID=362787 RepID=UPI001BC9CA88|nr:hypothetical protein [Candidatus Protochlamydia amoebophila]